MAVETATATITKTKSEPLGWTTGSTLVLAFSAICAQTQADEATRPPNKDGREDDANMRLAQANSEHNYNIPPGPLAPALNRFAEISGLQLIYDTRLAGDLTTGGVRGRYTAQQALEILLADTLVNYELSGNNAVILRQAGHSAQSGPAQLGAITVAGTFDDNQGVKADFQTSATKTPLPLRQTPQSVSVITQNSLETRQVQDLGQALETAAGVNQFSGTGPFGGKSPFGFDEITIRGNDIDAYYDVREDGFVSPTFFSQPDVAIYERIEVVKGPSSVLYGRSSAGGFVNRVRKKPLPELKSEVSGSIGAFDHYRTEADVTGPLLDSGRVDGRLVAAYEDVGSFVDGVESERAVLAPSLSFDLSTATRLTLHSFYQRDDFTPNPGFPLQQDGDRFRAPAISRSLFVGVPSRDQNTWETLSGSAQLEQDITDTWLATLRLQRTSQDSPIDIDSYAYGINAQGDVYLYSSAFDFDTDAWSGELLVEGSFDLLGRPADVAFGTDYSDLQQARNDAYAALGTANIYAQNFADFPTVQPGQISRDSLIDNQSTGVFGQLLLRPAERLSVLVGGRYDWADSAYVDRLAGTTSAAKDEDFTGRLGATYDVRDNVSVYGLYAQSFFPNQFSTSRDGQILEPQVGEIYESGVKTEWLAGRLGINAAVFRIDRDKVPIPDPDNGPGESFSVPSGLQRTDGVELEINGEPLPGWKLSFAGSLLDSEFVERNDPFFGSIPAGSADWQVGLFTSYELQDGPLKGFGLGAGLYAIDDRGVSTFIPGAALDGYERVDLQAFYNGLESFDIRLQVRNVFDERYVEGADRTGAYAQFGSPRAALLTLRYHFGGE